MFGYNMIRLSVRLSSTVFTCYMPINIVKTDKWVMNNRDGTKGLRD